ncbi:MAG: sigma-70 family RNA polymerase sigma factor [Sedimentisphaerales bacterium]|nr:sigma-70 family RNA polymerase sigma factor [Sedimentisphaerales bacterium]
MKVDKTDIDVQSLARGDETEWDKLALLYSKLLQDSAYAVTREVYLAQDVVQNVLLSMWENRSRLSSVQSLPAYLVRAIKNAAIAQLQKYNFPNRVFCSTEQLDQTRDPKMPEPIHGLYQNEIRHVLDLMRAHLTASQRRVFDVVASDPDASARQIGKKLSCSHQNVRATMRCIRQKNQHVSTVLDGVTS